MTIMGVSVFMLTERRCTNTCPAGFNLNQNTCQCGRYWVCDATLNECVNCFLLSIVLSSSSCFLVVCCFNSYYFKQSSVHSTGSPQSSCFLVTCCKKVLWSVVWAQFNSSWYVRTQKSQYAVYGVSQEFPLSEIVQYVVKETVISC